MRLVTALGHSMPAHTRDPELTEPVLECTIELNGQVLASGDDAIVDRDETLAAQDRLGGGRPRFAVRCDTTTKWCVESEAVDRTCALISCSAYSLSSR